jgi:hypothetical protein
MVKGESVSSKPEGSAALKTETPVKLLVQILSDVTPDYPAPDHLGKNFDLAPKAPTNPKTCPKHIQKESDYIKWLCTGEWSTGGKRMPQ